MWARDVRLAFLAVWLILSGAILLILLAPLVLPAGTIATLLPPCEWQVKYGRPCAFCGMTTAFILISQGHFDQAFQANHLAIPLYLLFVLNEVACICFVVAWACKKGFRRPDAPASGPARRVGTPGSPPT